MISSCRFLQKASNGALEQVPAAFATYARWLSSSAASAGSAAPAGHGTVLPEKAVDYMEPKMKKEINYTHGPAGKVFIETCYGLLDFYKPYGDPPVSEVEDELYDHVTGIARIELEALERGEDLWAEDW